MFKLIFKMLDCAALTCLVFIVNDKITIIILLTFITILNIAYFVKEKRNANRLNAWYEYSTSTDQNEVILHFTPMILIGYWADSSRLIKNRNDALTKLDEMGINRIVGKTMSLVKINQNEDIKASKDLEKWSLDGLKTLFTTVFMTVFNLRNICTLTVSRKLYLLVFKSPYKAFVYSFGSGAGVETG